MNSFLFSSLYSFSTVLCTSVQECMHTHALSLTHTHTHTHIEQQSVFFVGDKTVSFSQVLHQNANTQKFKQVQNIKCLQLSTGA